MIVEAEINKRIKQSRIAKTYLAKPYPNMHEEVRNRIMDI